MFYFFLDCLLRVACVLIMTTLSVIIIVVSCCFFSLSNFAFLFCWLLFLFFFICYHTLRRCQGFSCLLFQCFVWILFCVLCVFLLFIFEPQFFFYLLRFFNYVFCLLHYVCFVKTNSNMSNTHCQEHFF